ncbi:hypothetical protein ACFQ21_12840 [Ohtaekwangia kribbensis]|uniref:Uncharacterized protein n=1 Tax=Ohtaekwangia kribbensis TaxID=688913 RepID=A0ABW3K4V4_9BACT
MNPKFKQKYDELREGNPSSSSEENAAIKSETDNQFYQHPGSMRSVCFAWPNGNKHSFSYIDLVSKKLDVTGEINSLTLYFRSDTVVLKGYNLGILLTHFDNQTAYLISQLDPRYVEMQEENQTTVIDITVNTAP